MALGPICIGIFILFLLDFFFFSLGCVYLFSNLPCTFDGWVFVVDFFMQGFSSKLERVKKMSTTKLGLFPSCKILQ
jgi:hypothetical protein